VHSVWREDFLRRNASPIRDVGGKIRFTTLSLIQDPREGPSRRVVGQLLFEVARGRKKKEERDRSRALEGGRKSGSIAAASSIS